MKKSNIVKLIYINKEDYMIKLRDTSFHLFYKDADYIYNTIKKYKYINGEKCTNLRKTFKEFSKIFRFHKYFSYNWDSFDECINDLDWLNEDEYILIIDNCEKLLEKNEEDFKHLLKLLDNTAYEWKNGRNYDDFQTEPKVFNIILLYNIEDRIVKLFENLKIEFDYIR